MEKVEIGHNRPPPLIEFMRETAHDLSLWMSEHPIVQTEAEAKEAKLLLDRAKLSVKDSEDERRKKVDPLNIQVKAINEEYKNPRETLQRIADELEKRLKNFVREEERKREEAAREAARIAQEAEQRARDAERLEQEIKRDAEVGVIGGDIAGAVGHADAAFDEFKRAERAALLASKEARVKVVGGFTRAASLRNVEEFTVTDASKVLLAVGTTDAINLELIRAAKLYRTEHGELPPGITSIIERK